MIRNNRGVVAGLAVATFGTAAYYYYLRRADGDVSAAAREIKGDMNKARAAIPSGSKVEKVGEKTGLEGATEVKVSKPGPPEKPDERIPEYMAEAKGRIEDIRDDTARWANTTVDKMDRKMEDKASEAKGTVQRWFGGGR